MNSSPPRPPAARRISRSSSEGTSVGGGNPRLRRQLLEPRRTGEIRTRLSDDEDLRRSVEFLRSQNESIRAVFGVPLRPRAPNLGGPSNENARVALPAVRARLEGLQASGALRAVDPGEDSSRPVSSAIGRPTIWAAVFCAALALFPSGGPPDFRAGADRQRRRRLSRLRHTPPRLGSTLSPRTPTNSFASSDRGSGILTLPLACRRWDGRCWAPALRRAFTAPRRSRWSKIPRADASACLSNRSTRRRRACQLRQQRAGLFAAALTTGGFGFAVIGPADAANPESPQSPAK